MENLNELEGLELYPEQSKSYEPAPAGTHVARCISFVQLGTQQIEYQGIPGKPRMKIVMGFELPEELAVFDEAKGVQPFVISTTYNFVLGEKSTFQRHMTSWTKGKIDNHFNPVTMLGKPCQLTVIHTPSTKDPNRMNAKIEGISALTKNQECPPQINEIKYLLFQRWDKKVFGKLPEWMRKAIESSPEYKALNNPHTIGNLEGKYQEKKNPVDPYKKVSPVTRQEILDADDDLSFLG
jgi:hypothetical protein